VEVAALARTLPSPDCENYHREAAKRRKAQAARKSHYKRLQASSMFPNTYLRSDCDRNSALRHQRPLINSPQ